MGLIDRLTLTPEQGAALTRIATALERIADSLEGKTPMEEVPEASEDPVSVAIRDDREIDRFWQAEQALTMTLGRAPTAEELAHYVDGYEWDEADAEAARQAQQDRRGR
jgi:hypothetical protein